MMKPFQNCRAIVTGASSGIGRSLVLALARQGAQVGAISRRLPQLQELAAAVRAEGGTMTVAAADVAERAALHQAVTSMTREFGPPDLVIANAGIGLPSHFDSNHVDHVTTMMRVNFLGVVHLFDSALPLMLDRGTGHLVAISSLAAYKGLPGSSGYCASKAAVNTYCEGLRIELRPRGIAVTCICPGFVDTPMTANNARPMPFLMTADQAAERILAALSRRPAVYDFPKRMKFLIWLSRWAPDWLVARNVPAGAIPKIAEHLPASHDENPLDTESVR